MNKRLSLASLALMAEVLLACSSFQSRRVPVEYLTGQVTYLERMALPADAIVTVTLADVSRQDAPAPVVARSTILAEGRQVPIRFEVAYNPREVEEANTYAVRAQIHLEERLLFSSETAQYVITQGNPDDVDLILVRSMPPEQTP